MNRESPVAKRKAGPEKQTGIVRPTVRNQIRHVTNALFLNRAVILANDAAYSAHAVSLNYLSLLTILML